MYKNHPQDGMKHLDFMVLILSVFSWLSSWVIS